MAQGEGLAAFASVAGAEQAARLDRADRALDQALHLVLGLDEDDEDGDGEMTWRNDTATDQGLTSMAEALQEALRVFEGVAEALPRMTGPEGGRVAARLGEAATLAKEVIATSRRRAPAARTKRLELLTKGFSGLVWALVAGSSLEIDHDWSGLTVGDLGSGEWAPSA